MNEPDPITLPDNAAPPAPCWRQELRSASAEAQRVTGEILVKLSELSELISGLGIALVRVTQATEQAAQETDHAINRESPPSR